jgi:hypothetical protein
LIQKKKVPLSLCCRFVLPLLFSEEEEEGRHGTADGWKGRKQKGSSSSFPCSLRA